MDGETISDIRPMTDEEYETMHWPVDNMGRSNVIVLSNGTKLFPSTDPEGNAAGAFGGIHPTENDDLIGCEIQQVAQLSETAMEKRGWGGQHYQTPPALVLDDSSVIYPAADPEGNGPGELFIVEPHMDDGTFSMLNFQ